MTTFDGKWVLITGGAQRVGAVIAWHLAARGANLIIHYFTSSDEAEELKRRIEKRFGVRVVLVSGDLTKPGVIEAMAKGLLRKGIVPDAVLNNAAVFIPNDTKRNDAANKRVPLQMFRVFSKLMLAKKRTGSFIFYGDAWLARGRKYPKELKLEGYSRSKEWIHKTVHRYVEFGRKGIQVVAILNGPILPPKTATKSAVATIARQLCMAEDEKVPWVGPDRVAQATVAVLENPAIHASCIFVDAGRGATKGARVPKEH